LWVLLARAGWAAGWSLASAGVEPANVSASITSGLPPVLVSVTFCGPLTVSSGCVAGNEIVELPGVAVAGESYVIVTEGDWFGEAKPNEANVASSST
jgi:hypothetical protein